ncbi:hypothetical protein J8M20_10280 [Pseudoalteromonas luteoviolacea]|uniref:hypothetical protein n=1 Tax=Pseudoalteromonas luteoviolacea TaxID=43657 RepID=UPI001B38F839|nr:hypothetical protein [Pseudoalteromonas luteoviolacea]MBQ4811726.1 hypothetical protein [Pseudoalteromonas luteoviolacea]
MTLKSYILIIISILIILSNPSYALHPEQEQAMCRNDHLSHNQAAQRNAWDVYCKHISPRTYRYNLYADNGDIRYKLYYSTYYNPEDPTQPFSIPTHYKASCDRHEFTARVVCRSAMIEGPIPGPDQIHVSYPYAYVTDDNNTKFKK